MLNESFKSTLPLSVLSDEAACNVCGKRLTHLNLLESRKQGYLLCDSHFCISIMSKQGSMSAASFNAYLNVNKATFQRQRENEIERVKYVKKITREHNKIAQSVLKDNPEIAEKNIHILVLPKASTNLVPLAKERIEKYMEHLNIVLAEALEYDNATEVFADGHSVSYEKRKAMDKKLEQYPEMNAMSNRLCGMCMGGCCSTGVDHAYLSAFSLRKLMDNDPKLTAENINQLYRSFLPVKSIDNSCINHTASGCALPRELRSDVCNGFFCEQLKSYQTKILDQQEMEALLVIQRSSNQWHSAYPNIHSKIVNVSVIDIIAQSEI